MPLTPNQQALGLLARSNHALICFPEHAGGDGVATALGIATALERMQPGHQVDVVSSGFTDDHRQRFDFLPGADRVATRARQEQKLTIRIPTDDPRALDIRHAITDGAVEITLIGRDRSLPLRLASESAAVQRGGDQEGVASTTQHITHSLAEKSYDAIVVVDAPDLSSLGALYTNHAAMFQTVPVIALDHAPEHERYGQIHCIDVTASACGEVAARIFMERTDARLDADVATCLLTGILVKTRSFRTPRMGSKTFEVVGYLLECGARREEIVARLFQTKTVAQLQLWGRALTRLRHDRDRGLVWTILSQHDFLTAGARADDLSGIVDDLLSSSPDAQCILLLAEQPDRTIHVTCATPRGRYDAAHLLRPLDGTGSATLAHATLPATSLPDAEKRATETITMRMR